MLDPEKTFEVILNKYKEIKRTYLESLNVTSKILTVLREDRLGEIESLLEQRDRLVLTAEKQMKDVGSLCSQTARDLRLLKFSHSEVKKHSPAFADAILHESEEITGIVTSIRKFDEDVAKFIEKEMTGVKKKIQGVDVSKMLNSKYKKINPSNRFDRNV